MNKPAIYRILLVEDEVFLLFSLKDGLQRMGLDFDIVTAVHGVAAIQELRKAHFDLVITDITMVGPGGMSVTEEARRIRPGIKIVWLSAYDHFGPEAERLSVDRYLVKPVDLKVLRQTVREVLGLSVAPVLDKSLLTKDESIADNESNILILEDDRELTRLFSKSLRMVGFMTYIANSIDEGRQLLTERRFDILLADIHMGQEKSLDLLHEVMPHLPDPSMQIIIMSGDPMYREVCENLGINFYMEKPVAIGQLVILVKRLALARQAAHE